ncbi:MAG: site-specific integrase [Bacteroidota bacterium]|nr:site-specific integrase [Bacteroidota bacterium]
MLAYTVRAVLWTYSKNTKKIYPLKIAVTINRKVTYLMTPHRITEDQWENGEVVKRPNAKLINADVRRRIAEKEKELMEASMQGRPITAAVIKGIVSKGKTFIEFAKEIRDHRTELPRFERFDRGALLTDIDPAFLRRLEKHERDRGVCGNTISGTFKYIGQIMRQAKREKLIQDNPFDAYKAPKYVNPERTYLIEAETRQLIKLVDGPMNPTFRTTAIYFLLGCYAGLRHSDWGKFDADKMLRGGLLRLRATKNKVDIVLPVGPTLQKIIDLTRNCDRPHCNEKCNDHLKAIGPLAGISKTLTCHVSRHTFGYLCASNRLPKEVTAELMGITVKTVEVYYHLSGDNIRVQAAVLASI